MKKNKRKANTAYQISFPFGQPLDMLGRCVQFEKMKFWIYLKKELTDLQSDFEKIFGVDNLNNDYENVWEWIESSDRKSDIYLNISRPHDWNKGEYGKPIIIKVESNNGIKLNEEKIARSIKERLKCEVFAGEIFADKNDNPVIKEERKY